MKNIFILWVILLTSTTVIGQNRFTEKIKDCPGLKKAIDDNKDYINSLKSQTYKVETTCDGETISKTFGFPKGSRGDILGMIAKSLNITDISDLHTLKAGAVIDLSDYCFGQDSYTIKTGDFGGIDCIVDNLFGIYCDHDNGLLCNSNPCIEDRRELDYSYSYDLNGVKEKKFTRYEIVFCNPKRTEIVTIETDIERVANSARERELEKQLTEKNAEIEELEEEVEELEEQGPEVIVIKEDSLIYERDTLEIPLCTKFFVFVDTVTNMLYVQGVTGLQFFGFVDSDGMYNQVPLSLQAGYEQFYMVDPANCKARSFYGEVNISNLQARALDPDKCRLIDWHMWKFTVGIEAGHHWWKALNDEIAFIHGPRIGYERWFMDAENKRGIELSNSRADLPDVPVANENNLYLGYEAEFRYYISPSLYAGVGVDLGYSFTQKRYWVGPSLKVGYALSNIFVQGKKKVKSNNIISPTKSVDPYEELF